MLSFLALFPPGPQGIAQSLSTTEILGCEGDVLVQVLPLQVQPHTHQDMPQASSS